MNDHDTEPASAGSGGVGGHAAPISKNDHDTEPASAGSGGIGGHAAPISKNDHDTEPASAGSGGIGGHAAPISKNDHDTEPASAGSGGIGGHAAPILIDIHTHLHPPKLFAAIRRWFAENSDWDIAAHPTEPHDVAAALREAGVERFVFFSYAHKTGMARELNTWLAATARELGGFGVPLATVHPNDPDPAADIRAALDDGCRGLKLHEDVQRVHADDPRLAPVYDEMAARGAFLLVHAGSIPWEYVAGAGIDRVTRVLERHPDLNVVVAHYGAPDSEAYFAAMDAHPRLHLDTTMVFARDSPVRGDIGAFDAASIVAHADRVLYGTDYPNIPYEYGRERAGIEALDLPPGVLAAVLHGNAARLLREAEGAPS